MKSLIALQTAVKNNQKVTKWSEKYAPFPRKTAIIENYHGIIIRLKITNTASLVYPIT